MQRWVRADAGEAIMRAGHDEKVVASKWANAPIASVKISPRVKYLAAILPSGRDPTPVLEAFQKRQGSLWVGGTATLTNGQLRFKPNAMNSFMQEGELELKIPLRAITGVTLEGGFITKIIAVATPGAIVRLRCFGAAGFAKQIRGAAGLR
jgi:hypothetical protein